MALNRVNNCTCKCLTGTISNTYALSHAVSFPHFAETVIGRLVAKKPFPLIAGRREHRRADARRDQVRRQPRGEHHHPRRERSRGRRAVPAVRVTCRTKLDSPKHMGSIRRKRLSPSRSIRRGCRRRQDYGSIEVGKVADVIATTGEPIDTRSQIKEVFVKGPASFVPSLIAGCCLLLV